MLCQEVKVPADQLSMSSLLCCAAPGNCSWFYLSSLIHELIDPWHRPVHCALWLHHCCLFGVWGFICLYTSGVKLWPPLPAGSWMAAYSDPGYVANLRGCNALIEHTHAGLALSAWFPWPRAFPRHLQSLPCFAGLSSRVGPVGSAYH